MGLTPYQYGANNPILMIDINGDSIYIYNGKEKILYHNGSLYWAGTGQKYNGNAINKKGNLTGFVSDTKNALDAIRTGGQSGQELIDYIQNGTYKDVGIQYGQSNQERSGLIDFNPSERQSDVPNQDGTYGRDSYIGLAHELGHSWDRFENGDANF